MNLFQTYLAIYVHFTWNERTQEKIFTGVYYLFDACTLVVKRDLILIAVNLYWFDSGRGIFL